MDADIDMQAVYQRLQDVQPENIDIDAHFFKDDLKEMPEIEKTRYRSIKLNYLIMLEFGIPATMPDFMRKRRKPKNVPPPLPSDSESDEEWKPKKKKPKESSWRPPPSKKPRTQRPVKSTADRKSSTGRRSKNQKTENKKIQPKSKSQDEKAKNSDDEEFLGFTESEQAEQEHTTECRIKSLTEAISKLDTDDITLSALEALEPTILRSSAVAKNSSKLSKETRQPTKETSSRNQNPEVTEPKPVSAETTKSPGSVSLLPLFGCSSQSSNTELAELLNDDALDIAEVDPKSWDNLLESLGTMSPSVSRNTTPVCHLEGVGDQEALVRECYSHLQSQPAAKILDLAASQGDSGLGDVSVVSGSDSESTGVSDSRRAEKRSSGPDTSLCRYPKRSIDRVNYKAVEVPDDDEFIWCEDCQQEYKGDCPICGPLIIVEDTPASQGDPQYASKTLPEILYIEQSSIPGAGSGVFAKSKMQKGVRFGPYQGQCVLNEEEAHNSGYSWEIQRGGKTLHYVDARVTSESNWMRYVNCARNSNEQNLLAFQYCGRIYYRTLRDIYPREELLVWYGDAYGEELGLRTVTDDLVSYWNQELQGFHCPQPGCTMMYTDSDRMIVHLLLRHRIILKQTFYHCLYCRRSCKTETQLREHMRSCRNKPTGESGRIRYGDDQMLASSVNKYRHQTDDRYKHKCDVCGKGFKTLQMVETHMRVHTGERPFRCEVCGKGFTTSGSMERHARIHTGDKPYVCQYCGKRFSHSFHLKRHVRTHTGEKPFKCDECGARFNQKGDLNKHIRIHTGDRPYKCNVCGRSFTQGSHLNKHKRSDHPDT